jgi:hypothetical protein
MDQQVNSASVVSPKEEAPMFNLEIFTLVICRTGLRSHTLLHHRAVGLFLGVLLGCLPTLAQVPSGIPQFGTFSKGSIDTINLATLNVHLEIPVRHTPGRGIQFDAAFNQETAVWYPAPIPGQVPTAWGWNYSGASDPNYPFVDSPSFHLLANMFYASPLALSATRAACTMSGYSNPGTIAAFNNNGGIMTLDLDDNLFAVGELVTFSGFKKDTSLNGLFATVLSSTSNEITVSGLPYNSNDLADSGTVTRATDLWDTTGSWTDVNNTLHPIVEAGSVDTVGCITGQTSYTGGLARSTDLWSQ